MVKSGAQRAEQQAAESSAIHFPKNVETDFSTRAEANETLKKVEKVIEKPEIKFRYRRLKKRTRNRPSNIL